MAPYRIPTPMLPRFRATCALALVVSAALFCVGCGKKRRHATSPAATIAPSRGRYRTSPPAVPLGYSEEGIASWYGIPYHGRPAADGEIYDMETLVAAHRTLPFHTWLRVTNLANGKTVTLRVIDRGPFVDGRVIDLSKAAAREIGLLGPGVGRVRLEVVAAPADVPVNDFYSVQVGAFSVQANAERVRADYARRYGSAVLVTKQGSTTLWRVLVGKESSIAAAQQLANTLSESNRDVFIVRLDQRAQPAAPVVSSTSDIPVTADQGEKPSD